MSSVRPGENGGLPGAPSVMPGADVALSLDTHRHATLRQAAWTDPIAYLYGLYHHYVPVRRDDLREGSGAWVTPRLILNHPFTEHGACFEELVARAAPEESADPPAVEPIVE